MHLISDISLFGFNTTYYEICIHQPQNVCIKEEIKLATPLHSYLLTVLPCDKLRSMTYVAVNSGKNCAKHF